MAIRILKIVLVICVGLQALFYALQNIVNLEAAHSVMTAVLSMADHEYYPNHFGPPVTGVLVWVALWIVILGELLAGILCLKGSFDMLRRRQDTPAVFAHAKQWAVVGCGVAVAVWLGLFMAVGGAYFQMWQTELGINSLEGAFMYAVSSGIVLLFVNMPDEAPGHTV
ncbi:MULTISPECIES: DUF2165 domain-containing protein [unclassified Wenzhouxiangella]|uniref:DUF2165 domain-containing protein n=1 Tax=unclassified Wenzhouxiangella TaxID=2613841 RepID=UPI000E32A0EF|nr:MULTISPECIES: DUF2165 domain-containing protein [unclassified Wenzhouxiangella]RFF28828.1 DUF2165 domain-containing protein [Wenzhouxiangella sp. 15181]RFP68195.1 DUF2165 domain-containing protein [Wenzhouxiangella sp. 15190]